VERQSASRAALDVPGNVVAVPGAVLEQGQDWQIIEYVRNIATEILSKDPGLDSTENGILKKELVTLFVKNQIWSNIS
jgi:hypothetical protein